MIKKVLLASALAFAGVTSVVAQSTPQLSLIGRFESGLFDEGAAEISAYDAGSQRLFVTNAFDQTIDVIDLSDPANLVKIDSFSAPGGGLTSVAAQNGIVAVAVEDTVSTQPGTIQFFDVDGNPLASYTVGVLPDMVTFSPDGNYVLSANEGEPNDDYTIDPEGSISIINISGGVVGASVSTIGFGGLTSADLDASTRIFGNGPNGPSSIAQDLEPEYITVSDDSRLAWVSLQENNAIAAIDVQNGALLGIFGLGFKDHSLPGNGMDASNDDDTINITTWPTLGMYQPDAIANYRSNGNRYVLTANEGDARDYDGYSEEVRVRDLTLDASVFTDSTLQDNENLGRLKTTTATGPDTAGVSSTIYSYGARSFSIYSATGTQVYDSGDEFEQILSVLEPDNFNSTDDENGSFDNRSDDKGPEPEGIVTGRVEGRSYAFIGLERIGGVMVYDITDALNPSFVQYINTRDFNGVAADGTAGDLAPEGIVFISADDSPNGNALLVVSYEISGTVVVFEFAAPCATPENLNTAFTGPGQVTFSWDGDDDAFGYRLRVTEAGVSTSKVLASASESKMAAGFEAGETYNWSVRAACTEDTSGYAPVASFTMPVLRTGELATEMTASPNPVQSMVWVSGASKADYVTLHSIDGRMVAGPVTGQQAEQGWDLSAVAPGSYLLKMQSESAVNITRIQVQ